MRDLHSFLAPIQHPRDSGPGTSSSMLIVTFAEMCHPGKPPQSARPEAEIVERRHTRHFIKPFQECLPEILLERLSVIIEQSLHCLRFSLGFPVGKPI